MVKMYAMVELDVTPKVGQSEQEAVDEMQDILRDYISGPDHPFLDDYTKGTVSVELGGYEGPYVTSAMVLPSHGSIVGEAFEQRRYIDAAPTEEERQARKRQAYLQHYGGGSPLIAGETPMNVESLAAEVREESPVMEFQVMKNRPGQPAEPLTVQREYKTVSPRRRSNFVPAEQVEWASMSEEERLATLEHQDGEG